MMTLNTARGIAVEILYKGVDLGLWTVYCEQLPGHHLVWKRSTKISAR